MGGRWTVNLFFVLGLFVFWVVLSATLSPAYLITGAIVSFVIVWINPKRTMHKSAFSWLRALRYGPWLSFRVLKSAVHISKLILQPSLPVKPQLLEHKTSLKSDRELTILGNSITLTPGTITIEIAPGELVVHALDELSLEDIQSGVLEQEVSMLFKQKRKEGSA
jgi:multicomponent Na+:H+ antiporter subunit E